VARPVGVHGEFISVAETGAMRTTQLAWGVVAWPVAAVLALVLTVREWDMSVSSALGVLAGTALAFTLAGVLVWLPAGVWLARRVGRWPVMESGIAFAGLGFFLGGVLALASALVLGNLTWPSSLGPLLQLATTAACASALGWLLASALDAVTAAIARRRSI
jgi:hypothetical protein